MPKKEKDYGHRRPCLQNQFIVLIVILFLLTPLVGFIKPILNRTEVLLNHGDIEGLASVSQLWRYTTDSSIPESSPALGDLDSDGKLEVVIGSSDHKLYALNGESGSYLWSYMMEYSVSQSPALGDIDLDGKLEVVITNGYNLYVLNGENGGLLWNFTGPSITPIIGDINGDGWLEVVSGNEPGSVFALCGQDGHLLWNYTLDAGVRASPALGDVDNDGMPEVIVSGIKIYALNGENGNQLWNYTPGGWLYSSPALADIDFDGKLEVTFGCFSVKIANALNGEDGSLLWSCPLVEPVQSSPAIGDINDDGKLEVIFGCSDQKVHALHGINGTSLWNFTTGWTVKSSPALGDVDGDGRLEVVVGSDDDYVYALNGEDGGLSWSFSTSWNVESSPALGDVNGDGTLEVVFGSNVYIYALKPTPSGQKVCWQGLAGDGNFRRMKNQQDLFTGPNRPFNPSPSNGVGHQNKTLLLSVKVLDINGDHMNVSFYDVSNDTLIGTSQNVANWGVASLTWGDLQWGTMYSWYAAADDGTDVTNSSTWCFMTNYAPDSPSNPTPVNRSAGVNLNPDLMVEVFDQDGDWMDVFFYDASTHKLIGVDTDVPNGGIAMTPLEGLSKEASYSWYVVIDDGFCTTQSATFSFITEKSIDWTLILIAIFIGVGTIAVVYFQYRRKNPSQKVVVGPSTIKPGAKPSSVLEHVYCIHCGFQNVRVAKFCKKCGAPID